MGRGRSSTDSFVVTRRILTDHGQEYTLEQMYDMTDRIFNDCLSEAERRAKALKDDVWYSHAMEQYRYWKNIHEEAADRAESLRTTIDKAEEVKLSTEDKKALKKELRAVKGQMREAGTQMKDWKFELDGCIEVYRFTEFDLHAYIGQMKHGRYHDCFGINIFQKTATEAWRAEEKVFFGNGKRVHYRKKGQSVSFEDKKASAGIIYHAAGTVKKFPYEHVLLRDMRLRLKPVREKDLWMQEAMQHKIKYCRIVRKPFGKKYHYFLQIVMEGKPPVRHPIGKNCCGLDPGVSTMTYYDGDRMDMVMLSPDVARYQKAIRTAATVYERRRRMAKPQNFNDDGTIRKDTEDFKKHWNHTKGMQEAVMDLKTAYRKQSEYVKQSNGYDTNRILMQTSCLNEEPMDYKALSKRAKKCKRQKKSSVVRTKQGKTKTIFKYKRKKRYGASILKHAPAAFLRMLERKISQQGGVVYEINTREYKASQYDHVTDSCVKCGLSDRTKEIGGHIVQRDGYSSFLIRHAADSSHPDREACVLDFKNFLKCQGELVGRLLREGGDPTGNFGLKDFIKRGRPSDGQPVTC